MTKLSDQEGAKPRVLRRGEVVCECGRIRWVIELCECAKPKDSR